MPYPNPVAANRPGPQQAHPHDDPPPTVPLPRQSTSNAAPPEPQPPKPTVYYVNEHQQPIPADWTDRARVPIRYLGLPGHRFELARAVPPEVIETAAKATIDHHRTYCGLCRYLTPLYNLTLGVAATLTIVAALALALPALQHTLAAPATLIPTYTAALAAMISAAAHRSGIKDEMVSRTSRVSRERGTLGPLHRC